MSGEVEFWCRTAVFAFLTASVSSVAEIVFTDMSQRQQTAEWIVAAVFMLLAGLAAVALRLRRRLSGVSR